MAGETTGGGEAQVWRCRRCLSNLHWLALQSKGREVFCSCGSCVVKSVEGGLVVTSQEPTVSELRERQRHRAVEVPAGATVKEEGPTPEPAPETVDHPAHYGGADNPYEAIKVIEAWGLGFNLGNTVKYIARAGKKLGPVMGAANPALLNAMMLEDLRKAAWYLQREIGNREKEGKR